MRVLVFVSLAAMLAGASSGCNQYAAIGDPDLADAGPDGSLDAGGDVEFCSGPHKVFITGRRIDSVTVSSERLVMDCCDGLILTLHLDEAIGSSLQVMVRMEGPMVSPGDYQLDEQTDAIVAAEGIEALHLTGKLRIEGEDYEQPILVSLCAAADLPAPLGELRIWVNRFPVLSWSWWERWGIWLLDDPSITAADAADMPLASLELHPSALIDLGDIGWYRESSHTIFFPAGSSTATWIFDRLPEVSVFGLPFVVVADGEPIYLGAFFSLVSSASFGLPVILVDDPGAAADSMTIDRDYTPQPVPPDPRSDPRILRVLQEAGKLVP